MLAKLRLFGLLLTIDRGGNVAAPSGNIKIQKWSATATDSEVRLDCWLEVSASCTLRLVARLSIRASDGDGSIGVISATQSLSLPATTFGVWDRLFGSIPAGAAFTVKLGGIRYVSATFPEVGFGADDEGNLLLVAQQLPLLNDSGLPMNIFSGPGGLQLDLQAGTATFRSNAFRQRTSYGLSVDMGGGQEGVLELVGNEATSQSISLPLNSPSLPIVLQFMPDTDDPMALHVDLQDRTQPPSSANRVWVPLALQNHILNFTMGAVGDQALLNGMSVTPGKNGGFDLLAYAYSDRKNRPALLQSEKELSLVSRIGEDVRPSTLLIAAAYPDDQPLAAVAANDQALHGIVQKSRFSLNMNVNVHCARFVNTTIPLPASLHQDVVRELTLPFFKSIGATAPLTVGRPGDSWFGSASGPIQNLSFGQGTLDLALPLLPPVILQNNFLAEAKEHYAEDLDTVATKLNFQLPQRVTHETNLNETPVSPTVAPSSLFVHQLEGESGPVQLAAHTIKRSYGPITLQLELPIGQDLDYLVITPDKLATISAFNNFNLVTLSKLFATSVDALHPPSQQIGTLPAGIAKFNTKNSLLDILAGLNADNWEPVPGKGEIKDLLHPSLTQPGWMGLILFQVPFASDLSQAAGQLIPQDLKGITYLALTPTKEGASDSFSVTARMLWQNNDKTAGSVQDPQESLFRLNELDIVWHDRRLVSYYANAKLQVQSFFGVQRDQPAELTIIGSYDQRTDAIAFLGRLPSPQPLLPSDPGFGPIRQVSVSSASINMVGGKVTVSLDGTIDLASVDLGGGLFRTQDGRKIQFSGLGITIDDPKRVSWQSLQIQYPSIQLNFDLPPFNLGFLAAKMNTLWMDWPKGGKRDFNFDALVPIKLPQFTGPNFIFDLSLDLMKLPELALVGLDRLNLDFYIGLGLSDPAAGLRHWVPDNLSIGLRALGFDHLNLSLMRFLEITADTVKFDSVSETDSAGNVTKVPCLALQNVAIKILGRTIVNNLTAYLFSQPDGQACFAIFSAQKVSAGPISIRWIMVGHNISLNQDLAVKMMEVGATSEGADQDLVKAISDAGANKSFTPGTAINQGRWIFAAAFSFAALLEGKFLFQDHAYYGIALGGGIFKDWFGYDIAISVLYIKGRDPSQDAFAISLRVPQVTLPAFQFMGGELALNIALNGSFVLDIGFPHLNSNGARQWDRALGAIITPFQGSGGFYIQKYTVLLPVTSDPAGLLISAGYAVQIGIGGSFGGGVFTAWVTAGIYFIVEGAVYLNQGNITALRLAGAVGLVVRGGARLNFWIISVSIEIMLSAEARAVLIWGRMPDEYKLIGGADAVIDGGNKVALRLDLTVYASARAEACIGGGWFRLCKSISVSIPLRYSLALELN